MICTDLCPTRIIRKNVETGFPHIAAHLVTLCTRCGHCEAACPENAVTIDHPSLKNVPKISSECDITPAQLAAYCFKRRSIRKFQPQPVDRPILDDLFDIVRYAPSGINRQPVKWIVVHDTAKVRQLANAVMAWMDEADRGKSLIAARMNFSYLLQSWREGNDPICRNAPHLAVACCKSGDRMGEGDAVIALSHLELAAPAFGLGACWAGYFRLAASASPAVKEVLGLPADQEVSGTMMLGYPATRFYRIPKRNFASITWK